VPWDRIGAASFRRVNLLGRVPSATDLVKAEAARASSDPDFRWLVDSIAAAEKLRGEKALSLNLDERKAERERLDAERLARENQRRKAKGEPVFGSLEEMEKSLSDQASSVDGTGKTPDVLLERTTQIMGDVVAGLPAAPETLARKQSPAAERR